MQRRVAFVYALPFHRWILDGLANEISRTELVLEVEHQPDGPYDWLAGHMKEGEFVFDSLRSFDPDVIVVAEYPVSQFRACCPRAKIVATRHSLAARGNTWERDYLEADHILTWSPWDESEWLRRHRSVESKLLLSGCVWGTPIHRVGSYDSTPEVAWCPTWNGEYSYRKAVETALCDLQRQGWHVVVRPHPATFWRESGWLDALEQYGFEVHLPDRSPFELLARTSVLMTDVSGIGLWAMCVGNADLPVVWIDPDDGVLKASDQYDPTGPEWVFRSDIGERVSRAQGICGTVLGALENDRLIHTRRAARDAILGPPEWMEEACWRAARMIGNDIGINDQPDITS